MEQQASNKKYLAIALGMLFLVFFVFFVIRPAIIGYTTLHNKGVSSNSKYMEELKNDLLVSQTNLSSCIEFNSKLLDEMQESSDRISGCKISLGSAESELKSSKASCEEKLKSLNSEVDKVSKELEEAKRDLEGNRIIQGEYDLLAQNAANNICCKSKVDNPNIKYYRIDSNKIVCAEEGNLSISC